jgi:hypothetical protein
LVVVRLTEQAVQTVPAHEQVSLALEVQGQHHCLSRYLQMSAEAVVKVRRPAEEKVSMAEVLGLLLCDAFRSIQG